MVRPILAANGRQSPLTPANNSSGADDLVICHPGEGLLLSGINLCVCVYSVIMAMLHLITNLTISIKTDGGSVSVKALYCV